MIYKDKNEMKDEKLETQIQESKYVELECDFEVDEQVQESSQNEEL